MIFITYSIFCEKNKGNLALNQNVETCIFFGLIFIKNEKAFGENIWPVYFCFEIKQLIVISFIIEYNVLSSFTRMLKRVLIWILLSYLGCMLH